MSIEGQRELLAASVTRTGEVFMPVESPKQLANVEAPLDFSWKAFFLVFYLNNNNNINKSLVVVLAKKHSCCQDVSFDPWKQYTSGSCTTPLGIIDLKIPAQEKKKKKVFENIWH